MNDEVIQKILNYANEHLFEPGGNWPTIKKDGINARQVISKDELDSLSLSTDEVFATVIEHLKRSYYL